MRLDDWFLEASERGNPHATVRPWSEGNRVEVLVHGAAYFARLHDELCAMAPGDWIHFTDWRGDPDQRLTDDPRSAIARVLAGLAERGVHVRGLVWRSHPDQAHFSEQENLHLVETINDAGGEVLLDERVVRAGSHHQKLFVIRHAGRHDDDVAFVGGIDLCHGRRDDHRHVGDPQPIELEGDYGPHPAWHDAQLEVHGPAVGDLARTFRERWEDPTPIDHRNPLRRWLRRRASEPSSPDPLPPPPPDPAPAGPHAVQVLRTYPARRPRYPFAPDGERSIAHAYFKAFRRARRLIYVEDQYLWSSDAAEALVDALERAPELRIVAVVPRHPDRDGALTGPPYRIAQNEAMERVEAAGGDRVMVLDLEAESGRPVYVHAKVCIIDDVWMIVGSDNLNRRSWTNDSELSCAVLDSTLDEREPRDPAGLGDHARRLPRDTRLRLWCEHLGRDDEKVEDLLDPVEGAEVLRRSAQDLADWDAKGRSGARPSGRVRIHRAEPVPTWAQVWARPLYRTLVDPDGRPWRLRRRGEY
ncbi:MAG TPA: phospholipase D family protein [Microthrixaceae bacterium]|nr:phospholipase D family protein [Microthrixaceae bacterium]